MSKIPKIFGIVNITPDSFSDGGLHSNAKKAFEYAEKLSLEGADIIDVGAESTRPDAVTISENEEWQRLQGFFELAYKDNFKTPISIDSRNPATIQKALDLGAKIINDVSGLKNEEIINLAVKYNCKTVFMHSLTIPADKNITLPENIDVIEHLKNWALEKINFLKSKNLKSENLIFDAGIGFGKNINQNWQIINRAEEFLSLNIPILIGHSEKSFLSKITDKPAGERLLATCEVSKILSLKQIDYLRLHKIKENLEYIRNV
ncbi:MAG: dihydropteroate synthase [Rickettsiales bacterium]|nr:dihydropteroate synthase [Rickettsiales bacterium]